MDRLLASCGRYLGAATAVTAVAAVWAIYDRSLLAGPLAVVFVGIAFWWSLTRVEPAHLRPAGNCAGCATGCVRCRERIDV